MKPRRQTTLASSIMFFAFLLISGGITSTRAQQIQVTAADPPSTAQGTLNLNVKVTGKGFKNGAKAKWFVTGTTDPGGVTVNSTTFVSGTEVTANITVTDTAVIANFDIAVSNADGRGGKGTELFAVTSSTNITTTIYDTNLDGSVSLLQSDDLNPDLSATGGAYGIYQRSDITGVIDRLEGFQNSDSDLHLENSTTRWISLTLSRLSGSGPGGAYFLHARVISRCFDPTGATTNTVNWSSITTSDSNCAMRVNFVIGGTQYTLVMSPSYANTGRAVVSCNLASGGSCVDWSVATNLTQDGVINPNPGVANLYSIAPRNGKQVFIGTYYLTYRMHITYP